MSKYERPNSMINTKLALQLLLLLRQVLVVRRLHKQRALCNPALVDVLIPYRVSGKGVAAKPAFQPATHYWRSPPRSCPNHTSAANKHQC